MKNWRILLIVHIFDLTIGTQEMAIERNRRKFSIKAKIPTVEDHAMAVSNLRRKLETNIAHYQRVLEAELKKLVDKKLRADLEYLRHEKEKQNEKQRENLRSNIYNKYLASRVTATSVLKDFYSRF